jgi:glycosyltransferase involved in cell wall biosynthesis
VILIVGDRRERAGLSLRSILDQGPIEKMEVLLLDCGDPGETTIRGGDHRSVRYLRLQPGLPAGYVRAEGVRRARAPIVAFLEEHAWAMPGWAEAVLEAHAGPWAAVGPEMICGNPGAGLNALLEAVYYPLWSPPAVEGEMSDVGHHNSAYKREVLTRYGELLEALMYPEELLVRRLHRDGYRLYLQPAMKVLHFYETYLRSTCLVNYLSHRGIEAGTDTVEQRSFWRRAWRFVILPFSPFRRALKLWQTLRRHRPGKLPYFWRGLPVAFVANVAAALGGMVGLVFGMQDTAVRFLDCQVNLPRIVFVEGQPRLL